MRLKLKDDLRNSIVAVHCGSRKGTAFFVSANKLITANHVVSEYEEDSPVTIFFKGKECKCRAEQIPDVDVAVLTLESSEGIQSKLLPLLAAPEDFEDELLVAGFPKELGNNKEMFSIRAKVIDTVGIEHGYNCVMERVEPIAFKSYKGFSGSPVLNAYGSVIGIVTYQLTKEFAYISVNSFKASLDQWGIDCANNWELQDRTKFGAGKCRDIREKTIDSIKGKLNEYHVPNRKLQQICEAFCDSRTIVEQSKLEEAMLAFATSKKLADAVGYEIKPDEPIVLTTLYQLSVEKLSSIPGLSDTESSNIQKWYKRLSLLKVLNEFASVKFLLLYGVAGTGKTHTVCKLAEKVENKSNVYLMLGTQFNGVSDVDTEFKRLLGFGVDDLPELDKKMVELDRDAIFIIDALNEGAGELYWRNYLNVIISKIEKTERLKLLVTVRQPYEQVVKKVNASVWKEYEITGFENLDAAIEIGLLKIGISREEVKDFYPELHNPLFMNIFCNAYPLLGYISDDKKLHEKLYQLYVLNRNQAVTELCDEDPMKNISWDYLLRLANYSLYYHNCQDIPRQKARMYADRICRRPLWSNNLLRASLMENLLLDTLEGSESQVMFQYENLGDVLKAIVFHNSKMNDAKCVDFLVEYQKRLVRNNIPTSKFYNFVGALIGLWSRDLDIVDMPAFKEGGVLFPAIEAAKRYSDGRFYTVIRFSNTESELLTNPDFWVFGYQNYPLSFFEDQHSRFCSLTFYQLNLLWVPIINAYFERNFYIFGRWQVGWLEGDQNKSFGIALCWMMASSHPEARGRLIRNLWSRMMHDDTLALFLIEKFSRCQDPYVSGGLLTAVYGLTLRSLDRDLIGEIAESVYSLFYANNALVPNDLFVRQYSLQILERADNLGVNKRWTELINKCSLRFDSASPFDNIITDEELEDFLFYGKEQASKNIAMSMGRDGDFCRYIIGINNFIDSENYYRYIGNNLCEPIKLWHIRRMLAYYIKNELHWDDELAKLDKRSSYTTRFENQTERIGKKFQWIALHNIAGRMCDHCMMMTERYHAEPYFASEMEKVNYPWISRWTSRFDPTLPEGVEDLFGETIKPYVNFTTSPCQNVTVHNAEDWINDVEQVPQLNMSLMSSKNEEWVFLGSHIEEEVTSATNKLKLSSYTISLFIPSNCAEAFEEWFKKKNVYGRWMPESGDNIDFRWNEYPLSASYKLTEEYRLREDNAIPFPFRKACVHMLQEDHIGLDEDIDYLSNVEAPCDDMMNRLNLYTAERGVVRRKTTDEIVSINYEPYKESCSGILVKRIVLNEYLEMTNQVLFFGTLGEKVLSEKELWGKAEMKRYTSSGKYSLGGNAYIEINPMEEEEEFYKRISVN